MKDTKNKKGIADIRKALESIVAANGYSYSEEENKKKTLKKDIALEEQLVIENGKLTEIPEGKYQKLVLPNNIKSIGKKIFENIKADVLILPNSLKKITIQNFKNCKYIKEIVIPDSVVSIGNQAFMGCTGLKKITLPSNLKIENSFYMNKEYFSSIFEKCNSLCEITMAEEHPSLIVQNNMIFDKETKKIIFIPKCIGKVIVPPSINKCRFEQDLKILSFTLQNDTNIKMEHDSYVNKIECKVGDKVWTFDLDAQRGNLFEADFEYISDGLYPNRAFALGNFANDVLAIIQGSTRAFKDLGYVAYTDRSGCGPGHIASMFEFRLQLCKFVEEVYSMDYMTISKQTVSNVVRNYGKGEDEPYLQNLVKDYFGNHLEHITALENYGKLIAAALSSAIERRNVSECVNTITDLISKRSISASVLNDILIFAADKNSELFHAVVCENCDKNIIDILKEDCGKLMCHLIDIQEIEAIIRLLDICCITGEKFTEFITYAADNKKAEAQAVLTNYKREHSM